MPNFILPAAAATALGVAEKTLTNWRRAGRGPDYVRIENGRVRYTEEDLDKWRRAQVVAVKAAA